jgi:hypothetical protein
MPSVNISKVAAKAGSVSLRTDASAADARKALTNMRAQLADDHGAVSSGYLSIKTRKDGSVNLETRGRHEWGSFHSNKKDAARVVQNLILEGYGKHLNEESQDSLHKELNTYLKKTGERFGTQSFVKLIDRLDARFEGKPTAGQANPPPGQANPPPGRLNADFSIKLKTEGCALQAKAQFKEIIDSVAPNTASFFKRILSPGLSKVLNSNSRTQVVGDADGSMCRTVLSAINSGHMQLEESELKLLAEVMDAEATAGINLWLKDFQEDQDIAAKLDKIVEKATFKLGHYKLVFIGDILHDRFSNNKVAMDKVIRSLHAKGAVFITGNHDVYDEVNPNNDLDLPDNELRSNHIQQAISAGKRKAEKKNSAYDAAQERYDLDRAKTKFGNSQEIKSQNGFYGAKQIDKTASDNLLENCFTNAYFDSQTNAFYTHNGFEHSGVEDVYLTAFGFLRAKNAEELAKKMNDSDFNSPGQSLDDIENEIPGFKSKFMKEDNHGIDDDGFINKTNFRPADSRMQTGQLGPAGRTADEKKVTIFHGHNDNHGTAGNVENLNARSDFGFSDFSPITKVF